MPNSQSNRLSALVAAAVAQLSAAGIDNPQLDARILISHALQIDRMQLLSQFERLLTPNEATQIESLIARRLKREPVARILGSREFWGLNFGLNEATLEPRPDSETLIEAILEKIATRDTFFRIIDIGTGTGCLLLSLLHELPNATGLGVDLAPRAVEQATINAEQLRLSDRAFFKANNWIEDVEERFDIVVANPPYIVAADVARIMPEVRDYDPKLALDGGHDGLDPYRLLIPQLSHILKPDGLAAFEGGYDHAQIISALFKANGFKEIATHKDLAGVDRVVTAKAV